MNRPLTDAELTDCFYNILGRGLLICAVAFTACLVAFTSSCCGRIVLP